MSTNVQKRQLSSGISIIAIAAALSCATPAYAQADLATLQGHVDGAKAGTQVVATDNTTGQKATGAVDASGNYSIIGLRPSNYTVSVEGREPQTTTLLVGQTSVVDFVQSTGTGGAIVVTGRRGGVREVRTPTVSTNITPAQIENLPQNQRNFLDFAALAPGIQVTKGDNRQVQAGALASSNVNVLLDGMSFKNPINHGGVFGQNFGLGNPFPQIAIQEYQVQTQNFGAETGQAGSAVITAITKTGGNQFHGSAFIEWQPKRFITQPFFDKKNNVPKPDYDRKQFGGELGGPIIPGKLTFYAAGEGTIYTLPGTTGNVTAPIPQNVAAEVNVPHSLDFKQGLYFGKLTFFATDDDTINLSAFVRRENNLNDIDGNAAPSHGRTILTHQNRYQAQWRHTAGDFLNTLNIAYDKGEQSTPAVGTGPEFRLTDTVGAFDSPIVQLGAHFFVQGDKQRFWTIKDDATYRMGDHTLKGGVQFTRFKLSRTENDHQNGTYYFLNPGAVPNFDPATAVPWGARINIAETDTFRDTDSQLGLYIQDEWKPDEHWTVNAGLRWDYESNPNNNDYVTPQAIADALRNYEGWKVRGIDAEDYISNGHNRDRFYGAFQPRLGVAYDVKGDRDLVFFGGAGRYYDRSLFIESVLENLINQRKVVDVNFAGACNVATPPAYCSDPEALREFVRSTNVTGGEVRLLNNNTKIPYSDQFDLGVRKRFGEIQTSLTFSHIRSHNIFMYTRANFYTNGWYSRIILRDGAGNPIGCINGGDAWIIDSTPDNIVPNCPAVGSQLPGFQGKLDRGTSDGKAHFNAVYLTAEKPFTDFTTWGFTTALTIQSAKSNVAQELNADEYFLGIDPHQFGWQTVNGTEKWRWVSSATWRAPLAFILSGQLTLSSGQAFGHLQPSWNSALTFPDGSPAKGNFGGVYWPNKDIAYKRLDLRVAKVFKMPWGHELTADFQVYNVFNWLNRNYPSWDAGQGDNPPRTFDQQVARDARSYQAGLRYKF
ncbi:MAG TPA: TonB-dependent receptor [Sphingomicrobium sp.]